MTDEDSNLVDFVKWVSKVEEKKQTVVLPFTPKDALESDRNRKTGLQHIAELGYIAQEMQKSRFREYTLPQLSSNLENLVLSKQTILARRKSDETGKTDLYTISFHRGEAPLDTIKGMQDLYLSTLSKIADALMPDVLKFKSGRGELPDTIYIRVPEFSKEYRVFVGFNS